METKKVTFKIRRFNPKKDEKPYYEDYTIDVPKGMTILEALQYIKDNIDPTLSFRAFCRSAICGSCSVKINGYPKLACKTQVFNELEIYNTDTLIIEPLDNMEVIRDLIVNWDSAFERMEKMNPYLIPDPEVVPETLDEESKVYPRELKKFDKFTDCILCTSCYSMCGIVRINSNYGGPFPFARVYRFAVDPRDSLKKERAKVGYAFDMWNCVRCNKCADVCPKHIAPVDGILKLRGLSIEVGLKDNPGARHVMAFYKSLLDSGMLNEVLLPLRAKGLKGVIENLSLGIKLILKGRAHSPFMKPIKEHETLLKVMKVAMEVE
ncbi:succinate dehydrogenase and fumarate reductase iron-sulfur protein [Desulfurobacterium thermolithotrophum DSM 11699]|uniref:Fumarate reductase iron-sulfur subunit n=1 Tax=Desulfurobacterium thermolithotrophum (strain DSM 11699 / BSA) TaxID=868864 RepID=F0S2M8_DESTD|nr:succinate dehydrogenase/fumarate reductase iron-sulfur subunit [Desulfurobacterium thermolithotrophum]ADY73100.1 succinate dehydrogenase and fumarate reductase iron-sulfur protein [Desulfurobacterium thermolithotrophum DSM 11699]